MHWTVLALEDSSALALVGVLAIVAVCLLALALVAVVLVVLRGREPERERVVPWLGREPVAARRRASARTLRGIEIDVPTRHADAIIHAMHESGWSVRETGTVVATDEDEEGLTTLSVDFPLRSAPGSGEEIH